MRSLLAGLLGVSILWGEVAAASVSLPKRRPRPKAARPPEARPQAALKTRTEVEPPPAGEVKVYWAVPLRVGSGVPIRSAPAKTAPTIGELRPHSAAVVDGFPGSRNVRGCREWLIAPPTGYMCRDDVLIRPGYLSDPPALEVGTSWQRYKYGVVRSPDPVPLVGSGGSFLRGPLRKGDGVTILREQGDKLQLYSRGWLERTAVQVTRPSQIEALDLHAIPPDQRYQTGWLVPPPGETAVRGYSLSSNGSRLGSEATVSLPRYSVVQLLPLSDGDRTGRERVAVRLLPPSVFVSSASSTASAAALASGVPVMKHGRLDEGMLFEVDKSRVRRLTPAPIPDGLTADEHWLDVSLSEQVAVAYVERTPVMATLVSTGKHTTPPGSFFIYRKYQTQTMANRAGAKEQYDFREVPHAQFFNGRIGFHAALWHDSFGHPVSHGCVNLSPVAAEKLFAFTKPELPIGWHSVTGFDMRAAQPALRGTRVIVRP